MAYQPQMNTVRVVVTAAQIKALHTVPLLIIPGVAGCVVDLRSAWIQFTPNTTPFGVVAADDTLCFIAGTPGGNIIINNDQNGTLAKGFVDQAVRMGTWSIPTLTPNNAIPDTSTVTGAGVFLTQFTQFSYPSGANWTVGDGTLTVIVRYAYVEA